MTTTMLSTSAPSRTRRAPKRPTPVYERTAHAYGAEILVHAVAVIVRRLRQREARAAHPSTPRARPVGAPFAIAFAESALEAMDALRFVSAHAEDRSRYFRMTPLPSGNFRGEVWCS